MPENEKVNSPPAEADAQKADGSVSVPEGGQAVPAEGKPEQDNKGGEAPEPKPEAKPEQEAPQETGTVNFRNKVDINYGVAMPQYNVEGNKAYKAIARDKNRTGLFAIVCQPHLVPRLVAAKTYEAIINPNIANLALHGKVYWPPAKAERYVLIYLDNLGKPILKNDQPQALGWKQDDVMDVVVKPMLNILLDFKDKDFVHGAVRATNIFDAGATGRPKKVLLGECLSAPASYMQPALYETIERSMADPISRGKGTQADDLYALGVTLAVCLRSTDPLKDVDADEIIRQKIKLGSYAAITGKDRFKGEILELLRGLLHDDPSQRWTLDEVQVWMDGRRLSPKQALIRKKAPRPVGFANKKYFLAQTLAMDLDENPIEVKRIIEDDVLFQWLKRSVEDEEAMERLDKAIAAAKQAGTGPGFEDRLVAQVSCALDPMAPLRFKKHRLTGDGIGTALAEAIVLKQDVKVYAEILTLGLVLDWLAMTTNSMLDINGLFNRYEQARRLIRSQKLGEGLERCLYLLSVECPCLSEILKAYYISIPYDMLRAFEDMCSKGQAPEMFLDRHSVAFLMQRSSKVIEPQLFELNSHETHKVILANLKTMAAIQKHYDGGDVPAMSKYFANKLASVYEKYHDRNVRGKIQKAIEDIADKGDLQKMVLIIDNLDLINKDEVGFRKAVEEFAGLEKEKQELVEKLENKEDFGVESGREMAAIVSSVLAAVIILGMAFMFFSGGALF